MNQEVQGPLGKGVSSLSSSILRQELGWAFHCSVATDGTVRLLCSWWEEPADQTKRLPSQGLHSVMGKAGTLPTSPNRIFVFVFPSNSPVMSSPGQVRFLESLRPRWGSKGPQGLFIVSALSPAMPLPAGTSACHWTGCPR